MERCPTINNPISFIVWATKKDALKVSHGLERVFVTKVQELHRPILLPYQKVDQNIIEIHLND